MPINGVGETEGQSHLSLIVEGSVAPGPIGGKSRILVVNDPLLPSKKESPAVSRSFQVSLDLFSTS